MCKRITPDQSGPDKEELEDFLSAAVKENTGKILAGRSFNSIKVVALPQILV